MTETGVVSCGRCAQANWIPAGWDLRGLGCTHCGVGLAPGGAAGGRTRTDLFKIAGILGFIAVIWFAASHRPPSAPTPVYVPPPVASPRYTPPPTTTVPSSPPNWTVQKPTPQVAPTPIAPSRVPIFDGVVREARVKNRVVPLKIRGAPDADYFIKIVNTANGEETSVLFVTGGNTITATMPFGIYQMRFASGKTWYGEFARFGSPTQYWVADQKLVFRSVRNRPQPVSIVVAPASGGALKLQPISTFGF